jgi:hypothetical protein
MLIKIIKLRISVRRFKFRNLSTKAVITEVLSKTLKVSSTTPKLITSLDGQELGNANELMISARKEINKSISLLNQNRINPEFFDATKFNGSVQELHKRLIALNSSIGASVEKSKLSLEKSKVPKSKKS